VGVLQVFGVSSLGSGIVLRMLWRLGSNEDLAGPMLHGGGATQTAAFDVAITIHS